jgi:hypothetical protein
MSMLFDFLRSLLLTTIFSGVAPILLVGGAVIILSLVGYIPGLEGATQTTAKQILQFLATFGSGHSFRGLVVIGLTCSFVGALFDTYTFYRYQSLRSH